MGAKIFFRAGGMNGIAVLLTSVRFPSPTVAKDMEGDWELATQSSSTGTTPIAMLKSSPSMSKESAANRGSASIRSERLRRLPPLR